MNAIVKLYNECNREVILSYISEKMTEEYKPKISKFT